jgi:hypothetical protein
MTVAAADYIALLEDEQIEFGWSRTELNHFYQAWGAGQDAGIIAKQLKRDPDEVAILIISLRRQELIGDRTGGWRGNGNGHIKNRVDRKDLEPDHRLHKDQRRLPKLLR